MLRGLTGAPATHVAMTVDAVGGVWTYALDLARGLGRAGVGTTLVVCGPPPSEAQRRAAEAVPGVGLVETDAPLDWTARDADGLVQAARAVAAVVRERKADLVHLNSPALAAFAEFDAPVLGVCHSCLATWWRAVKGGPPPADVDWRIEATAAGYAACRALVAPTRAFAGATAEIYRLAMPHVIANGRAPVRVVRTLRDPFVLAAGRLWDEGKDIRTLDDAARDIEAPVVALGPLHGPDRKGVRFDRLRTPGALDPLGVATEMADAAVFVSTARYEPFGLAVLEAAQAGLPLVLSDIPTFRELWTGAAQFVTPGDAAGFAAAVNRLLASPEAGRQAGVAARRQAHRYDVAAMTERYLALYGELGVYTARSTAVPA